MKKELTSQEIESILGGRSLSESFIREIYHELQFMSDVFRVKEEDNKTNNPVNAYDMIEYNKRNA